MIFHVRQIPSCPGYFVSDTGRVWGPRKELRLQANADGYLRFTGPGPRGQPKTLVHHVVAEAFLGAKPVGAWVCHRNDLRTDNRMANLYYGDVYTNNSDTFRNGGRSLAGEAHTHARLTWNQVKRIRQEQNIDRTRLLGLAGQYGVSERAIRHVVERTNWQHLTTS